MNSLTNSSPDAQSTIRPGNYYSNGIPYLPIDGYPGKIIAIEGTDGVGRSTQIRLLREWLEVQGYGVIETGWTRSELMQPTIELAKASNTLNKLTFVLLYATDFADRLEKEIIPALKAGFVRSEEHTSELQSQFHLVCRLLLEKKKFEPATLTRFKDVT